MEPPQGIDIHVPGRAKKVTIFVGHYGGGHGKHGYVRILEWLKEEGATGATAFKAIAAFGARSHVQTIRLADVAPDLPVMIVWIDTPERVERLLPELREMIGDGLIAVEDTEVLLYTTAAAPELPVTVTVGDVMTREPVTVHPATSMREVVDDLVEREIRSVPVVDSQHRVIGIITNGDLIRKGGLPVRLNFMRSTGTTEMRHLLRRLGREHSTAREVMTSPAVTVPPELDVRHAAELMCRRKLKRLPVVDSRNRLVGMVSRVDLLRAMTGTSPAAGAEGRPAIRIEETMPISTLMTTTVPTVRAEAHLQEVIDVVLSTRLSRAVVVDGRKHVAGIITDSELIERLNPEARPGLLTMFTRRLPFVPGSKEAEETYQHLRGTHARDVMLTHVVTAQEDDPVGDVLAAMLTGGLKVMPIVNQDEELVGLVDRAALLQVLTHDSSDGVSSGDG